MSRIYKRNNVQEVRTRYSSVPQKKWGKKIKNKNNVCVFYLFEPKLWVRLSQDVLARGGDVAAVTEVECLEV